MKRRWVHVGAALCVALGACWAVLAVGRMGVMEWAAELPASATRLSKSAQERAAEASLAAAQVQAEKPKPVVYRQTIKPPRRAMAARSNMTMGETWNATLEVLNQADEPQWSYQHITDYVTFAGLGGSVSISHVSHEFAEPHEDHGEDPDWYGVYEIYSLTAGAPGDSDTQYFYLWIRDEFQPASGWGPLAHAYPVLEGQVSVDASISVSGLFTKETRTDEPPDDREVMDYSDQEATERWWADESTTVTVTASGDGLSVSASGDLGYGDEEVEIGESFYLALALSLTHAPVADHVYAQVAGIQWGDSAVGGSAVDLYKPGDPDDYPDNTIAPGWSRTQTTENCYHVSAGGTVSMDHLQGTTSAGTFNAAIAAPAMVGFDVEDGQTDSQGPAYAITYTSNMETWDAETEMFVLDEFSTDYAVVQAWCSWLYEREWRRLTSYAIRAIITRAWQESNGEDVGDDSDPDANDQTCALLMWPLTASDRTSSPYWTAGIAWEHLSEVDVNDTMGLAQRASLWEADVGVTVDPTNNDLWTVAAGAGSPAVDRSLATRYWLRMERLGDHLDDPGAEHHPDWPIMLKANLPIEVTLDDPDWWDSETGGVDAEDITNWAEFSYLRLGITAPRAGTCRLVVDYSVPSVSDPCYTDFTHRFGAEGEWSYTRTRQQISWSFAVEVGANTVLLDMLLNDEDAWPVEGARLHVVDSMRIELEGNDGETAEEWELTELALVLDPGEGERVEPESHINIRYKRSWNWDGNWFGFGAVVDGKPAAVFDYGYGGSFGYTGNELGMLYIQRREHSPDYEGPATRLDYAKGLSTWATELDWQEGWEVSWPSPGPEYQAENQDSEQNQVTAQLRWWDMRMSDWNLQADPDLALAVGTYNIAAGVRYTFLLRAFPRGGIHGVAVDTEHTQRLREQVDEVEIYEQDGESWTLVDTIDTDEHGYFRLPGLLELGGPYRVGEDGPSVPVTNRSYTWAWTLRALVSEGEPYIDIDELGVTWLVAQSDGYLRVYYLDARETPPRIEVTQPTTSGGYSRPSIAVRGGELLVAATDATAGDTILWSSLDRGETWTQVATDLGTGITLGTVAIRPGTGEVLLTGIDSSDNIVLRMASDVDLPRDDLTAGVDEITIAAATAGARSTCQAHPDGSLIAAVQGSGGVDFYRCRSLATGFAAV